MISVHFQGKLFNITIIQVYALTNDAKEAEVDGSVKIHENFQKLTAKKEVLFIIGNWNAKELSQEIPGVTGKFGLGVQNEAEQRLTVWPREHMGHTKHPLPTTQETALYMDITGWAVTKSD